MAFSLENDPIISEGIKVEGFFKHLHVLCDPRGRSPLSGCLEDERLEATAITHEKKGT